MGFIERFKPEQLRKRAAGAEHFECESIGAPTVGEPIAPTSAGGDEGQALTEESRGGSMLSRFAHYVSLNVLGMIGLSVYIVADTFFIAAGAGADGLAALNFAVVIYMFLSATGQMVGIGSATAYQVHISQGDREGADRVFVTALAMAALFAMLFLAVVYAFSHPLLRLVGASGAVLELANTYLLTIMSFTPFFLLNNTMLPFVRNDGAPKLAMAAMLTGSLMNIFLDWLFVIALGWGMVGAAFATGLAPIISLAVLSTHILRRRNSFHLRRVRIDVREAFGMMSLGFSTFVVELASGLVVLVLNLIILPFEGTVGVAAYGVVANFAFVASALFVGVAQGLQPLASRAYAQRNAGQLLKVLRYAVVTSLLIAAVWYVFVFVFAEPIAAMFNRDGDPQLAALAVEGIRIYFAGYFFAGLNIVIAAFFSAIEQPARGLAVSLVRGLFAMVACAYVLARFFGMLGVWSTFPVAELITFAVAAAFAVGFVKKTKRSLHAAGA